VVVREEKISGTYNKADVARTGSVVAIESHLVAVTVFAYLFECRLDLRPDFLDDARRPCLFFQLSCNHFDDIRRRGLMVSMCAEACQHEILQGLHAAIRNQEMSGFTVKCMNQHMHCMHAYTKNVPG
jgi:hypothetical protein